MKRFFAATVLALMLVVTLFATPRVAFAATTDVWDECTIFASSVTIEKGETRDCSLVVFGGNVTIEEGATIAESLVVLGGNVEVGGTIEQDVVILGGNADLLDSAFISGQLVTLGGSITRADGATVEGGDSENFGGNIQVPNSPLNPFFQSFNPLIYMITEFIQVIVTTLLMGILAMLVVVFLPEQTSRVSAAVVTAPVPAALLGFVTSIAAPVLIVVTAITICLIPVSLFIAFVFAMGGLLGWFALGSILGARLVAGLKLYNISPPVSAFIGTALLTFLTSIFTVIPVMGVGPFLSGAISLLLSFLGLGAVVLTRFGSQPYIASGPSMPSAPSAPTPPPPAPDMGDMPAA